MPSSSKSPQAPSTKSHSFLRKSTDESPSKTTSTSVPSEVKTSQSNIKLHIATSPNLLLVLLTFVSQEEAKGSINVDALLDAGCLAGDFVAKRIVDRLSLLLILLLNFRFVVD